MVQQGRLCLRLSVDWLVHLDVDWLVHLELVVPPRLVASSLSSFSKQVTLVSD